MTNNYLVSVIIPVYNVEGYLNSCLDSVINQSYNNLEIVLVDDGSKDNSGTICDEYAQKDKRIIVIHKKNEGVAQARIDGFNRSSGELVTFVDSDDYVDLCYIEKLVRPFEQYEIDLSICNYSNVTKGRISHIDRPVKGLLVGEQIKTMISSRYLFDIRLRMAGFPLFLVTKMIKREFVLDALLYARGLWMCEDQVASFHIVTNVKAMFVLSEPLYYYVKHEGQATKKYNTSLWTNQFECWKRYKDLDTANLLANQLPARMWWTFIRNIRKMIQSNITCQEFKNEMMKIEDIPMWLSVLGNANLPQGRWEKLVFFFLKHKMYSPLYFILICSLK
jgi:glycosyltransferase involved in cell wall biosynthesis